MLYFEIMFIGSQLENVCLFFVRANNTKYLQIGLLFLMCVIISNVNKIYVIFCFGLPYISYLYFKLPDYSL